MADKKIEYTNADLETVKTVLKNNYRQQWGTSIDQIKAWTYRKCNFYFETKKYIILIYCSVSREKISAICAHLVETDVIFPIAKGRTFQCFVPALSKNNSRRIIDFIRSYDGPNGTPLYELRRKFSSESNIYY